MSNGPQVLPLSRSTPNSARSAWAPFRHRVYKRLWIATVVSNIGAWMYSAAASWLMTSLDPHPVMVALVQAVTSLPMFLFAIPAGALADIIEKRRFILTLEIGVAAVAALFASLLSLGLAGAGTLLAFVFLVSSFAALEAPAWQAIVPQLVSSEDLPAAVAANSVGINISRAIGPALAGILIGTAGITAPFWIDALVAAPARAQIDPPRGALRRSHSSRLPLCDLQSASARHLGPGLGILSVCQRLLGPPSFGHTKPNCRRPRALLGATWRDRGWRSRLRVLFAKAQG